MSACSPGCEKHGRVILATSAPIQIYLHRNRFRPKNLHAPYPARCPTRLAPAKSPPGPHATPGCMHPKWGSGVNFPAPIAICLTLGCWFNVLKTGATFLRLDTVLRMVSYTRRLQSGHFTC
jgi:hypothetical protein